MSVGNAMKVLNVKKDLALASCESGGALPNSPAVVSATGLGKNCLGITPQALFPLQPSGTQTPLGTLNLKED